MNGDEILELQGRFWDIGLLMLFMALLLVLAICYYFRKRIKRMCVGCSAAQQPPAGARFDPITGKPLAPAVSGTAV